MDVNPKSIKTEELYGFISMATREWKDGLLSKASKQLNNLPGTAGSTVPVYDTLHIYGLACICTQKSIHIYSGVVQRCFGLALRL